MILENKLYCRLNELSNHKRDKSELMTYYINKRLDKSIITYSKEL